MTSGFARAGAILAFGFAFLLGACGGQHGAPQFEEAFGAIDSPCGGAASDVLQHCTAHVLVVNRGGEGVGHVTIVIELKDAKAGSSPLAAAVKCGRSVPETPAGGYADLVCNFDVPPGKTTAPYPTLQSIDYQVANVRGSLGFDFTGASILILAGAVLLLGAATLIANSGRRVATTSDRAVPPAPRPDPVASRRESDKKRVEVEAEYDIPNLPR